VPQSDERDLVRRCQTGDWSAFRALLEPHREGLYRLACRLTSSSADADDVMQESLVKALRGLASFDARSAFATWLWRIVCNTAADFRRHQRRRAASQRGEFPEPRALGSSGSDPLEIAAAGELSEALDASLQELPFPQRAAFALVVFEGKTYAQTSEILGCAEGTVAWRIAAARERLTGRLAPFLQNGRGDEHAV